jgi:hypothetical protein
MFASTTVRVAAVALALPLAVTGCGSGSAHSSSGAAPAGGSSSAIHSSQTTPGSTSDVSETTSGATVDGVYTSGNLGVARYLRSIQRVRHRLLVVRSSTSAMVKAVDAGDAATAGDHALAAASGLRGALAIAGSIHPQEPLASIHPNLMANLRLGIIYLTRMSSDLHAVDVNAIHRWRKTVVPKIHQSERLYREWAATVAVFCTLDGIKPPAWLKTMDQWN